MSNKRIKLLCNHYCTIDQDQKHAVEWVNFFMEQFKNKEAIYWYSQALQQTSEQLFSIHKPAFSTWLPHLQLSLLYNRLHLYENAHQHNELARQFKPNDPRILNNQKYLLKQLKK